MKTLIALAYVTLVAAAAYADEPKEKPKTGGGAAPAAPALSPEVKKTVDAFTGTWTFDGAVSGMPGAKGPSKATETLVCKKAGGGRVVSCSGKGTVAGLGRVEDEALVAWDAEAKNVRFVGMSSTGELHDHTCNWKDDNTLACEPLSVTAEGQPATVDLDMKWADAKHMSINETTTMKDGSKIVFEGVAKRK
jgi:hypothetical protein